MGWQVHHAIVVTSWDEKLLAEAHTKASEIFPQEQVLPVSGESMNGYCSFMVAPDGSKEGWPQSDTGDARRQAFKAWLKTQEYEDGSSSLDAVEVAYGECEPCVTWERSAGTLQQDTPQ